jgi:hypothetical protein
MNLTEKENEKELVDKKYSESKKKNKNTSSMEIDKKSRKEAKINFPAEAGCFFSSAHASFGIRW